MTAISYGDRRLGVLVPSGNSVAETELRAMLPPDVTMLTTRLELRGSSAAELLAMLIQLEHAAALLGHAEPEVIAFHCTAVSTFAPHLAGEIRDRISAATGRRAIATADAILAGLATLGARRVLLVTPYVEAVHQREVAFLGAHGVRVTGGSCLGVDSNTEMAAIRPETIVAQVQAAASGVVADACFISCTAIRSAGLIAALEATLGIPVITSNQVLVWHALQVLGIHRHVNGFGRLLSSTTIANGPSRRT
ncbi:maleate cis-trans isomerase family protein [Rhodopila sp.]|uniref:maleate cis-trans isomerase family protein n=1 Tax=Rhodopila sp. TaxID=2480087 RepID=UPI003D0AC706